MGVANEFREEELFVGKVTHGRVAGTCLDEGGVIAVEVVVGDDGRRGGGWEEWGSGWGSRGSEWVSGGSGWGSGWSGRSGWMSGGSGSGRSG